MASEVDHLDAAEAAADRYRYMTNDLTDEGFLLRGCLHALIGIAQLLEDRLPNNGGDAGR